MNRDSGEGYIDIHSHFLPGVDDGPENFDQCLEAAEIYAAAGVSCLVATPHCMHGTMWAAPPERIRALVRETENLLRARGIPLRILPGMEIAAADLAVGHFPAADFLPLGDRGGAFLIEFPLHAAFGLDNEPLLHKLLPAGRGKCYIIAHPERCTMFDGNIERARQMVARGMLFQVNIGSLLGQAGAGPRETALELLRAGLVHFLATDTHCRAGRMPPDPARMAQLRQLLGDDAVTTAFRDNPRRMLEGKTVQPVRAAGEGYMQTPPRRRLARLSAGLRHLFRSG